MCPPRRCRCFACVSWAVAVCCCAQHAAAQRCPRARVCAPPRVRAVIVTPWRVCFCAHPTKTFHFSAALCNVCPSSFCAGQRRASGLLLGGGLVRWGTCCVSSPSLLCAHVIGRPGGGFFEGSRAFIPVLVREVFFSRRERVLCFCVVWARVFPSRPPRSPLSSSRSSSSRWWLWARLVVVCMRRLCMQHLSL